MTRVPERELTTPVELCARRGRLNPEAVGWTRRPLHRCNLRGRWGRRKRWNYWAVMTESHVFSVTVASLDYAGLVFVYLGDLERRELVEKTSIVPLARGIHLPETVRENVGFQSRELCVTFEEHGEHTRIEVDAADLRGEHLSAEISVRHPPDHESLGVVIPWSTRVFQYTSKHTALPARGMVRLGRREIPFDGVQSYATLDFGRGIWPGRVAWNWGAASGSRSGRTIGLNFGGKWTQGTGLTENALLVDGQLRKISEELDWEYDRSDFMRPWRIHAPESGQVNLTFTPLLERVARGELGPIRSEVHQLFGYYTGVVTTAEREHIAVADVMGWAEDHQARW